MREIKFRAWDKKTKRMRYWDTLRLDNYFIDGIYGVIKIFQLGDNLSYTSETNLIPLQFTGLKSENGTDIYEGDIVGLVKPDSIVKWTDLDVMFYLSDLDGSDFTKFGDIDHFALKVFGNIYENPELITNSHPTERNI